MKKLMILGVTGSIGTQTIEIIKNSKDFEVIGISAGKNIKKLEEILNEINVLYVCTMVRNKDLEEKYPKITFYYGDDGLEKLASISNYDILVNALVGISGLKPTLIAIKNKKDIALANKETLVVAGFHVMKLAMSNNVNIYPIDSEHSAILQCLQGSNIQDVQRLIITASGGSFRDKDRSQLNDVTIDDALNHPNWSMGAKITIDSATMMNKGFEVIEAHWLFQVNFEEIEVIIHPESIVHSMVEFKDKSIIAQLGVSDMKIPISYSLSYPKRIENKSIDRLDFTKLGSLTFNAIDYNRFPLLKLAYDVGKKQGSLPAVLNAANEIANKAFLEGRIKFLEIEDYIFDACKNMEFKENVTIEDIFEFDKKTRDYVENRIRGKE
ncbi:MAG: 1-deoxy-D-xylulose-5-phosphate reductoisomerase [Anaerorhabdus sp.]